MEARRALAWSGRIGRVGRVRPDPDSVCFALDLLYWLSLGGFLDPAAKSNEQHFRRSRLTVTTLGTQRPPHGRTGGNSHSERVVNLSSLL